MKEIILHGGQAVKVDDCWFDALNMHKWHLSKKGYAQRSIKPGFSVMMHRIIAMTPRSLQTDHINGDKLDNRLSNLRVCTNAENCRSRRRIQSSSGYRGVRMAANGRYHAAIMVDYKKVHLGVFDNAIDAARVYDEAALRLHKSFASLNFLSEPLVSEPRPTVTATQEVA